MQPRGNPRRNTGRGPRARLSHQQRLPRQARAPMCSRFTLLVSTAVSARQVKREDVVRGAREGPDDL